MEEEINVEIGFKKQIEKVGDLTGIIFNKAEIEKHNLNIGNIINMDDAFIVGDIE